MKCDYNSQKKLERKNGDIGTHVNELNDDLQGWCENSDKNNYDEWNGDYRKDLNTCIPK